MSTITIPPDYNSLLIATNAGSTDNLYRDGVLHCDCSQSALDDALAAYNHDAEIAKPNKAKGFDYNGTKVPVTLEDASGAMQIKIGFEEFGMQSTNFELSNGEVLTITLQDWPTFKAAFFAFRASFFAS